MLSAPPLTRCRRELEQYLREALSSLSPPLLARMVRYQLGWEDERGAAAEASGKMLRPSFCLLACDATGGDRGHALPAAVAIELVHNFSLIHDDIQDRDTMRHHRPTVWSVWGEAQAINAGDGLLALARLQLQRLSETGVPAEAVIEASRLLDERTLEMVQGQTLDVGFEDTVDVHVPAYLEMVEKKSGALFDCALHMGALAGGSDASTAEKLGRIGRMLGTAFQIRDDVLGIWADEGMTGKPPGADIRRRKKSLPVVYVLNDASGEARERLRALYSQREFTEDDVSYVLACLETSGARDYCARVAGQRRDAAMAGLEALGLREGPLRELSEAAEFLLEREF